ncbi:uncharacterized protein [Rutidosis leptorrhynchoides]|uniref:uncharacterized protein isoform X1 n=1 Tax=Rutidosis leptorrhynchoides TaxID=125765 RepID=UPI003A99E880
MVRTKWEFLKSLTSLIPWNRHASKTKKAFWIDNSDVDVWGVSLLNMENESSQLANLSVMKLDGRSLQDQGSKIKGQRSSYGMGRHEINTSFTANRQLKIRSSYAIKILELVPSCIMTTFYVQWKYDNGIIFN